MLIRVVSRDNFRAPFATRNGTFADPGIRILRVQPQRSVPDAINYISHRATSDRHYYQRGFARKNKVLPASKHPRD